MLDFERLIPHKGVFFYFQACGVDIKTFFPRRPRLGEPKAEQ